MSNTPTKNNNSSYSTGNNGLKESTDYYVYSLNLKDGNKYVGITSNPDKRISDHFNGQGAKWTQKHGVESVNSINKCSTKQTAKSAEKIVYERMKSYHGGSKVRGAGYTKSK